MKSTPSMTPAVGFNVLLAGSQLLLKNLSQLILRQFTKIFADLVTEGEVLESPLLRSSIECELEPKWLPVVSYKVISVHESIAEPPLQDERV